jgi:two-component system, OmpR family, sensor histidine kinase KdpD
LVASADTVGDAWTPRGELKVFVGMAAGVGKTYAMLEEGQERLRGGEDVVIGWLETHGRAETAAQAEGLEVVPPLEMSYRGVTLRDMDTDAVLARAPQVALVDELAHTNAPGLRHAKRFADVEALLDQGIDVLSTVNVQHLESLNDRVFELTGVRVRETIPDRVLLDADDVVLVDLTPEALQARLRAGKVYSLDRVDRALLNFFTTSNLGALREVALREVAGAVDEQMQREAPPYKERPGLPEPRIGERVLVLARPERGAQRLVRGGWRAARRLGGELDVVCPEGHLDDEGRRQLGLIKDLAVNLGAHFLTVPADDVAAEVARLVADRGVTRLVMSAPRGRGLMARMRGDLLSSLLERLEDVDIFLFADREESRTKEL